MKQRFLKIQMIAAFFFILLGSSFKMEAFANEACSLRLNSTLSYYLSEALEASLISHLESKGYEVRFSRRAAYELSAVAVCTIDGMQAPEMPCSEALQLSMSLRNLVTGEMLLSEASSYRHLFFPTRRAARKVRSLMREIPPCE